MKWISLVWIFLSMSLAGCAPLIFFGTGTAAGVAGYEYYQGDLAIIYQWPFADTWDATLKALEQMNMSIESRKHDLTSGKIAATDSEKRSVKISISYKNSQETDVRIRVGFFGDQNYSLSIKEQIRKVLMRE